MNYYYNRLLEVVDFYKPAGKTLQTVLLKGDRYVGIGKDGGYFHYIDKLWYGIKHKRETLPENPRW